MSQFPIIGKNLMDYYRENGLFQTSGFYGKGQNERPFDLDADLEEYKDNENVFVADTLEELADLIDVPADALVETVAQYDADIPKTNQGTRGFLPQAPWFMDELRGLGTVR